MVYKKFVYKRGRKHGPYYYHSYRENNRVKKVYIGGKEEYKEWKRKRKDGEKTEKKSGKRIKRSRTTSSGVFLGANKNRFIVSSILFIAVLLVVASVFFIYNSSITGRVGLEIKNSYISGENISGILRINLKEGELLPIESKLMISQYERLVEIPLESILSFNSEGDFYIENQNIGGNGKGYGFPGEKTTYPIVFFKLDLYGEGEEETEEATEESEETAEDTEEVEEDIEETEETTEESEETAEDTEEVEEDIEETEEATEESEETAEDTEEVGEESAEQEEPEETEESEESEEIIEESEEPAEEESGSLITGEAVKEDKEKKKVAIERNCSKDNPFVYELEEGKTAKIKKGSVKELTISKKGKIKKDKVDDEIVTLQISNSQAEISTEYSRTEEGFGEEYLGKKKYLEVDLEELGIEAEQGTLTISLVYKEIVLAEISREISVTPVIEENITEPEGNITETNATFSEINITTKQYKAIVESPVKWIKTIKNYNLTEIGNLSLELPKSAQNITIKTGAEIQQALNEAEEYEQIVSETDRESLITGQVIESISRPEQGIITKLWNRLTAGITGKVISEQEIEGKITETEDSRIVDLTDIAQTGEEIGVEYYTESPTTIEENISRGKRIVVFTSTELNYSSILAYTRLDGSISINDRDKIRLYWYNENEYNRSNGTTKQLINFSAYDLNEDGFVDYIEWIIPHLSEQVYEIIYITKAEHLDSERNFIADIYDYVKEKDNNWSGVIADGEYVRVTFEVPLDNTRDITIYARANETNASAEIEVYTENNESLITKFENVQGEGWYKVFLDNLGENESYPTFDLKILGEVEFDYIVDPNLSIEIVSLDTDTLNVTPEVNFTHLNISDKAPYNDLILYYPFDGNASLDTVYDWSNNNRDVIPSGTRWTDKGMYGGGRHYDGVDDDSEHINLGFAPNILKNFTISFWHNATSYISGARFFGADSGGGDRFYVYETTSNSYYVGISSWIEASPYNAVEYGNWTHIAITLNDTSACVYKNGVELMSNSAVTRSLPSTNIMWGAHSAGTGLYFAGIFDELMIFNTSLTASQVLDIYNNRSVRFVKEGVQGFINQSFLNISSGSNRVNVSANFETLLSSNISLSIGYFSGGSWSYTDSQNLTSNNTFTILNTATNLSLNFTFLAGNLTDNFYSPILKNEINLTVWTAEGDVANTAPNTPVIIINSTDNSNKTLQNISCFATISDDEGDSMNITVHWYRNDTYNLSMSYNNTYPDGTLFNATLFSGNTTKWNNWSCQIKLHDGQDFSEFGTSINLTILNTAPSVSLTGPPDENVTTNRTPEFEWSGSDDDSDILEYEFNMTCYYTGGGKQSSCNDYQDKDALSTATSYIPSSYIKCLMDNGYYFNWSVRVYDGDEFSPWTANRNITIKSDIRIAMNVSAVNFGEMDILGTNDTTGANPLPLILQNDGNTEVNVSVSFTSLWDSELSPTAYFKYRIRNTSAGCFFLSNTQTAWANAPTSETYAINRLNFTTYQTGCSNTSIDLSIEVPPKEQSGNKSSVITFTSSLGEPGEGAD